MTDRVTDMFDIEVIRVLSILLEVGTIASVAVLFFFTWEREDLGSVKAAKPTAEPSHGTPNKKNR